MYCSSSPLYSSNSPDCVSESILHSLMRINSLLSWFTAKNSHGRFTITLRASTENPDLTQDSLFSWYKQHAELKLKEKSKRFAKMMNVEFNSVDLKTYRSRWGSCSVEGNITFNWKVIIAPNRIVDY